MKFLIVSLAFLGLLLPVVGQEKPELKSENPHEVGCENSGV